MFNQVTARIIAHKGEKAEVFAIFPEGTPADMMRDWLNNKLDYFLEEAKKMEGKGQELDVITLLECE